MTKLTIEWTLWYLWVPCVLMSGYNIAVMYTLDAPLSTGGRIARGLAYMACVVGLFSSLTMAEVFPINFPLAALAYFLLLASYCALTTQYRIECSEKKKRVDEIKTVLGVPTPAASTTEKIVNSMVGKPDPHSALVNN